MKRKIILFISGIIFLSLTVTGIVLARHKPLWNDELYTQLASVEGISYGDILKGRIFEGNNNPLFYLLQKIQCDIFHYRFPHAWKGSVSIRDDWAQVFLRLNPIIFMSLAVAVVFYFFANAQGVVAGVYAVALFCSSFMVWSFIAEARPYALWIFLTTVQTIILFNILNNEGKSVRDWKLLSTAHIFLSLTSVFGTIQAVIVCMFLWMGKKVSSAKDLIGVLCVPAAIAAYYFWRASKYAFHVGDIADLIFMNVSMERLICMAVIILFILFYAPWRKGILRQAENYIVMFFFYLLAVSFTLIFYYKAKYGDTLEGFQLATRYFMNLAPVSTLALVFTAVRILRDFRHDLWVRLNVHVALCGLIILEYLRAYMCLIGFYQW